MGRHAGDNHRAVSDGAGETSAVKVPDDWLERVLQEVCGRYGVSRHAVLSPFASTGLARSVRQIAIYLSRTAFDIPFTHVGSLFGCSHEGVRYIVDVVAQMRERDEVLDGTLDEMCDALVRRRRVGRKGRRRKKGAGQ